MPRKKTPRPSKPARRTQKKKAPSPKKKPSTAKPTSKRKQKPAESFTRHQQQRFRTKEVRVTKALRPTKTANREDGPEP